MSPARQWRRFWMWWVGSPNSPWVAIKWRITYRYLDKPTRCWARTVNWALGFDSLRDTLENADGLGACERDAQANGTCWCGRVACRDRMEEMNYDMTDYEPQVWTVKP